MSQFLDEDRHGPWAVITGASSGIGQEFARRLTSQGFDLVLVSRRAASLEAVGREVTRSTNTRYVVVEADLSKREAITPLVSATRDLDVGLVISNAGDAAPGEFLSQSSDDIAVCLLLPGPTATATFDQLGIKDPPMQPMSVEQCVAEGLAGLQAQRAVVIPGLLNRFMASAIPKSVVRAQTAKLFAAALRDA